MILNLILNARWKLLENNIKPKYIKLSPMAHRVLLEEINKKNNTRSVLVLEVCGMVVQIENECPQGTGYLLGEEKTYAV